MGRRVPLTASAGNERMRNAKDRKDMNQDLDVGRSPDRPTSTDRRSQPGRSGVQWLDLVSLWPLVAWAAFCSALYLRAMLVAKLPHVAAWLGIAG